MREGIVIGLAAIGLAFSLSGVVGILRMPDVYSRIQCSSKTITMGALPVLIALAVAEGPVSAYGSRALLVAVLLLVLNPVASHALARAAYKAGVPMWTGAVTDEVASQVAEQVAEERPLALEAAFKILVLTTLASFAVFIGAGLLYAETGALRLKPRGLG